MALVSDLRLASPRLAPRHFALPPLPSLESSVNRNDTRQAGTERGMGMRSEAKRDEAKRDRLKQDAARRSGTRGTPGGRGGTRGRARREAAGRRHGTGGRDGAEWGGRRVAGDRCRLGECPTSVRRKQSVMIKGSKRRSLGPSELVSRETYDSSSPRRWPGDWRGARGTWRGVRSTWREKLGACRGEGRGEGRGRYCAGARS